ncbi:MAG: nucleotidyl transferase AbiEii/AbiGii toxin family protein [Lachnospiraceae bacterium]|nr:nucleotidyl transferase AbiEii/AbiGii toxin family protein [Lachnospiraceae bacterium]
MNLHKDIESFNDLAAVTAEYIGIPMLAVKRDYYIVMMLQMLAESAYAEKCVFKGGTSLSKGYPGSILRFSEDIDITFIPDDNMSKKQYDKALKDIEKVMTVVHLWKRFQKSGMIGIKVPMSGLKRVVKNE